MINKGDAFSPRHVTDTRRRDAPKIIKSQEQYKRDMVDKSLRFSTTFLHMDKLAYQRSPIKYHVAEVGAIYCIVWFCCGYDRNICANRHQRVD